MTEIPGIAHQGAAVMLVAQPRPLTFEHVYEAHVDFVWAMLRRLGVVPAQLEDAVQDVFVAGHRHFSTFRNESSLKTWIGGIAVRVAHEHRRRTRRAASHESLDAHADLPIMDAGPHEAAVAAQAFALLERLLDLLDEDQRTVFVLSSLEELSAPDIAEMVKVPLNTAYSRLRLARAKLQQAFEAQQRGRP